MKLTGTRLLRALRAAARTSWPIRPRAVVANALAMTLLFQAGAGLLPEVPTWLPQAPKPANAETVASPRYVSAAVMPNGNAGLLYGTGDGVTAEIRFKSYTSEHAVAASLTLSTAAPWYPQLVTFGQQLVAAYVDTRSPNVGKLTFRRSSDNGATWTTEAYPFGAETFNSASYAPRVAVSSSGTLYVFTSAHGAIPSYRSTTDATLVTWTAAAAAGDATMKTTTNNSCGSSGSECGRAHAFGFMETATAGTWIYITKSASGFGQSGRGTQTGTLGGTNWSTQVDHGGSGGATGCCGHSTATTFLDRSNNIIYVRATDKGQTLYQIKSSNGGGGWASAVDAYNPALGLYTSGAPVGLNVPTYSSREYVWTHGWGGTENTVRVLPLWIAARTYAESRTVRLFGSAGGDLDVGSQFPETFGDEPRALGAGIYVTRATDLRMPGRILGFDFTRTYNSADLVQGALGQGWTHSYEWSIAVKADHEVLRRGDGSQVIFVRNQNGSYQRPLGVFDILVKNGDGSFTLTQRDQTKLEFSAAGVLTRIHEPAGNQILLAYSSGRLSTITDTVGRQVTLTYDTRGRLSRLTSPDARKVDYFYDSRDRLTSVLDKVTSSPGNGDYRAAVLGGSPAAYWRLGESSGTAAADEGTNGITGTYVPTVTLGAAGAISGDANTSVNFAGGYVSAPGGGALNITGTAVTVEAWLKGGAQGNHKYIVSKSNSGGTVGYSLYTGATGTISFFVRTANNGTVFAASPTSIWDNQWHHVVGVYNGAQVALYIDGSAVVSNTGSGAIAATPTLALNIGRYNGGGLSFSGHIDEVAVYPSALSAADISSHFRGSKYWLYAYDGTTRHLAKVTDPDGKVAVENTYDTVGRLATQKDGLGRTTTFAYAASEVDITDPRSHTTTLRYDSLNRLFEQEDTLGATTYTLEYIYDGCGNLTAEFDRNGNRTDYTYDTGCDGDLLERIEPQLDPNTPRFTTTYTYDSSNNVLTATDAKGFVSTFTYHATSNVMLSSARQVDVTTTATTKFEYGDANNPGLPTKVIAPRGNTTGTPDYTYSTTLTYDSSGNLISSTDADANQTTYGYDTVGRRTSRVDPEGNALGGTPGDHTWTTDYDTLDRVVEETDPLGQSALTTYDAAGRRTSTTDRNGNVSTFIYDAAGRLWKVQQRPDPVGQPTLVYETVVARDFNGNATSVTQANGTVTDHTYDALNRLLTTTVHPAALADLTTTLTLDGDGNVLTRTTADSVTTTYTYDTLDRLTDLAATGLTSIAYAYDELHRRTSMTDGTGTTTYTYDRIGRPTSIAQPNGTVGYAYDLDSNRTTLTYPGAVSVTNAYTPAGRLSTITDGTRVTTYTHTPSAQPATVTLPNSMVTTYAYDRVKRPTSVTNVRSGTTITSHSYTLDDEGNRTALTEFVSGITAPATTESFGLTYDGLQRLTAVTTTNAESFTLDAASNQSARTGPTATYTYDTANRLTSDGTNTFTWSTASRLTGRGADTFSYDPLDRLTQSVVGGSTRNNAYSGDGLLQSVIGPSGTTTYLWDLATSPARMLKIGADRLVYGHAPLYAISGTSGTTFAPDALGSIRAEVSDAGAVTRSFRYRSYGEIAQSSGASTPSYLGFAGELRDPSGLIYLRARWLDPQTGRFLTTDPVAGNVALPASMSAFGYSFANPQRFTDPSGTCPWCFGALLGAGTYIGWQVLTGQDIVLADLAFNTAVGAATGGVSAFAVRGLARTAQAARTVSGSEHVARVVSGLSRGRSAGVRVVESADELDDVFLRLTKGGEEIASSYPGKMVRLRDGTLVGLREGSRSGGRTIDVNPASGYRTKIHIRP